MNDKYRFENGSLYIYDVAANAYIHCFKNGLVRTKRAAIKRYEESISMGER